MQYECGVLIKTCIKGALGSLSGLSGCLWISAQVMTAQSWD